MAGIKITAAVAAVLLLAQSLARADERDFQKEVPADARGIVEVSNISGTVQITGWDRPQVKVTGQLGSGVDRVDVIQDKSRTVVKVVLPSRTFMKSGDAELQVQVPRESEVHVSAVSANVTSAGVQGIQRLNSVSGDISADLAAADADVKTVSGNVTLKGRGQNASLHVSTVSGDVHLGHAGGDIEAGTTSGNLVATLDAAHSLRVRSTSGDLQVSGSLTRGASIDVGTVSGDVTVRAAPQGGYRYEVSAFSGDIRNCLAPHSGGEERGPGKSSQGTLGEGAGRVRVKTMSGDVTLCDR